ncbi:MAG: SoxR reducing system RseC family protein [Defluviitaleaceae bacterium]|nr:SoxR reducing system RseC family protein [Defluviitaleaceae bacterium]
MDEVGQIVASDGDFVQVRMKRQKACDKCRACTIGHDGKHMILHAQNACGASIDDWVSVELDGGFFLRAVLIMYGAPLVTLLAGFVGGTLVAGALGLPLSEIIGFATGVAFAALTYVVIKKLAHKIDRKKNAPVAARIVAEPSV